MSIWHLSPILTFFGPPVPYVPTPADNKCEALNTGGGFPSRFVTKRRGLAFPVLKTFIPEGVAMAKYVSPPSIKWSVIILAAVVLILL